MAGKLLPLSESPIVPASFSTMLMVSTTLAEARLGGRGIVPIRNAPAMPLGTCSCALWWEWYMPTAGSTAVNS